jgi:starch phosphorylase
LGNDNGRTAKELAKWRQAIRDHWNDVDILTIDSNARQDVEIGATIRVSAQVRLGALQSDYVQVEVYYGRVDETGMLKNTKTVAMKADKKQADGVITYKAEVPVELTGQQGYSVRVLPHHPQLYNPTDIGTMKWFNK